MTVRWGIMGAGDISRKFVADARGVGHDVVAVGSGSGDWARTWADQMDVQRAHGSYADLADDDRVQAVYVGNNHVDHVAAALQAVAAGKPVLVEKPLGVSRADAARLFDVASTAGVFVMEAMWSRFLPAWQAIIDLVADGAIGTVRRATIRLGSVVDPDQPGRGRLFDPARAGGALLDMGIYPIALAHMVLGPPDQVTARADLQGGVDAYTSLTTRHGTAEATLECAFDRELDRLAVFHGDDGRIEVGASPHHPHHFTVVDADGASRTVDAPYEGGGFGYEAQAVAEGIAHGWTEHPKWRHADTLDTHAVLDDARAQIGLVYPFEQDPPD